MWYEKRVSRLETVIACTSLVVLLLAAPVRAQSTPGERKAGNILRNASLVASLVMVGVDIRHAKPDERKRVAVSYGLAFAADTAAFTVMKRTIKSQRPCARLSGGCGLEQPFANMPSGHASWTSIRLGRMVRERREPMGVVGAGILSGLSMTGSVLSYKHDAKAVFCGLGLGTLSGAVFTPDWLW